MTTTVSVVIPARNEANYIEACVQSVLDSDYPAALLDVWVVDGRSEDGTPDLVRNLQNNRVHLVDNPARVTPIALNLGIKGSQGEVVIILGGHATVAPDFVANNVAVLEQRPEVACAGGIINNIYQNTVSQRIGQAMGSPFGVGNAHFRTGAKSGYVDTVAFGAYRRSVLEEVGFFDEQLIRNQDDDLNFRITQAGHKIWLSPDIQSNYYVRASFNKLARQYFQYGLWKVFVNKKHRTVTTLRQLAPPLLVLALMVYLVGMVVYPLIQQWFHPTVQLVLVLLWIIGPFFYLFPAFYFGLDTLRQSKAYKGLFTPKGHITGSVALFQVIWIFLILHLSYGWGYWQGMLRFMLLNQQPGTAQAKSSR